MIRSMPRLSMSANDVQSVKLRNLSRIVWNLLHARLKSSCDTGSVSTSASSECICPVDCYLVVARSSQGCGDSLIYHVV
jgi:hypothetical protein